MNYRAIIDDQIEILQKRQKELQAQGRNNHTITEACETAKTIMNLIEVARHLPLLKSEPGQK